MLINRTMGTYSIVLGSDKDLEDDNRNEVDKISEIDYDFDSKEDLFLSTFVQSNKQPSNVNIFKYKASKLKKIDIPVISEDAVGRQADFEVEENTLLSYLTKFFQKIVCLL